MGMATNPWPNYADWISLPPFGFGQVFEYTATYAPRPRVRRLRAERGERRRRSTPKDRFWEARDRSIRIWPDEERRKARTR
jgi:hypothetical protein